MDVINEMAQNVLRQSVEKLGLSGPDGEAVYKMADAFTTVVTTSVTERGWNMTDALKFSDLAETTFSSMYADRERLFGKLATEPGESAAKARKALDKTMATYRVERSAAELIGLFVSAVLMSSGVAVAFGPMKQDQMVEFAKAFRDEVDRQFGITKDSIGETVGNA